MKKNVILFLFVSIFLFGCEKNIEGVNDKLSGNNLPGHTLYYSYSDYNNNTNSIYSVNIKTNAKETILNTSETILSMQKDDGKIYAIFTNRIGYVNKGKISYLTGEDEYVARYKVKNNILYYGKDNNNMSDDIYERLTMKNVSSGAETLLSDYGISQLLVDDNIYFKANSGVDVLNLLKYNLDGTDKKIINTGNIGQLIKGGDYIYFINYSDNNSIYKVKTNGTELTKVVEGPINFTLVYANPIDGNTNMGVIDNYLYYINTKDNNKLYKTDGSNISVVIDSAINSIYIKDNYIYCDYKDYSKSGIYLLDKDGKEIKQAANVDYVEYFID